MIFLQHEEKKHRTVVMAELKMTRIKHIKTTQNQIFNINVKSEWRPTRFLPETHSDHKSCKSPYCTTAQAGDRPGLARNRQTSAMRIIREDIGGIMWGIHVHTYWGDTCGGYMYNIHTSISRSSIGPLLSSPRPSFRESPRSPNESPRSPKMSLFTRPKK